jgi:hypothetical protein
VILTPVVCIVPFFVPGLYMLGSLLPATPSGLDAPGNAVRLNGKGIESGSVSPLR